MADYSPANSAHWQQLEQLARQPLHLAELLLDAQRSAAMTLTSGPLHLDYAKNLVNDDIMAQLLALLAESPFQQKRAAMYQGDIINTTEARAVLHTALRAGDNEHDARQRAISAERKRIAEVSEALISGAWRGVTGKQITDVINIGIGGSDLGPKMVCGALRDYSPSGIRAHFISNVDGAEIAHLTSQLDAATTLVIISSKTFTTQETLLNATNACRWLETELAIDKASASPHVLAVTASPDRARAMGVSDDRILQFWDFVGGRYSLWSAIGISIAISQGINAFDELLAGASAMDEHFLTSEPAANMPVILALLATWYNNFKLAPTQAVVAYCERLHHLPAFLQQLDMESNGKAVRESGVPVDYATGAIVWGQTGTNAQHAFFQLLHQGSHLVPVDFIAAAQEASGDPEQHRVLLANMLAQSAALASGAGSEDSHRHYPGNRPSNVLLLDALTPYSLGMLIALYEHKVFTQGVLWGINSFDQFGVELGKQIAGSLLEDTAATFDTSTRALLKRLSLDVPLPGDNA